MLFVKRAQGGNASIVVETLESRTLFNAGLADPSFSIDGGFVGANTLLNVSSSAADPNGKIIVGGTPSEQGQNPGSVGLIRFNPNGTLDTGFGVGGSVIFKFVAANQNVVINAVAVQPDGKVIIAGFDGTISSAVRGGYNYSAEAPFIARLTSAGALDPTFGAGGKVTSIIANVKGVAVLPSGKIIYGGDAGSATSQKFDVVRLNANGSTDTTYGTGGLGTISFGQHVEANDINLESDGKVVVAGDLVGTNSHSIALARFTASGAADATFGAGGKVITTNAVSGVSSALQSDDKIVIEAGDNNGSWIERFNANGTVDTTFGTGGHVIPPTTGNGPVAIQSNGEIIVSASQTLSGFEIALYESNGTLDPTFGTGGIAIAAQTGQTPTFGVQSISIQSSGRIFVAGYDDGFDPATGPADARFLGTHVYLAGGTTAVTTGTTETADPSLAGTVVASRTLNFSSGTGASAVHGQLLESVVKETATGTLDFYYTIVNATGSAAGIASLAASNFYGFTTYVDYRPDSAGTIAPVTASRSSDHKSIAFNFVAAPAGVGLVAAGQTSFSLFVKTNATHFSTGGSVLLNNVISLGGYEPVG